MNWLRTATAVLWRCASLLVLLLASDLASAVQLDPTYGNILRQADIWRSGCSPNTTQVTLNGTVVSNYGCSDEQAQAHCASKVYPNQGNYSVTITGTGTIGASSTDGIEAFTYDQWICSYTATNGTTYTAVYNVGSVICPQNAPVMVNRFPSFSCECPGEVNNSKCYPPPDPCEDAPENFIGPPSVPTYINGLPVSGNEACTAEGCEVFSSYCRMDVDIPDQSGRGCDYTPTSWTRVVGGVIDSQWHVLYTKTGSDCLASEDDGVPPDYPSDNDNDGDPDTTDPDDDNDNIPDATDTDPKGDGNTDSDHDNIPDATDTDDDNDNIPDTQDPDHPDYDPGTGGGGGDGGGSSGGDGGGGGTSTDTDNDGTPDTTDPDDDGDNIPDGEDPDHPDYTGGGGSGGGDCDPETEDCGTCDPATENCGEGYSKGGFYEPSYTNGVQGVYQDAVAELTDQPFMQSVDSAFDVEFSGSCPTWEIPAFGEYYPVAIQCDPAFDWVWAILSALILASASILAIRTALE